MLLRTKEPETRPVASRSYDLVRDIVHLGRMAPGTVLVLGPAVGVISQAIAVAITWPEWLQAERQVRVLVGVLSRQVHPSVHDVLPSARALVVALGIGLAASVLAWAAGAAAMTAPMRRAADRAASGLSTTLVQSLQRTPPVHERHRLAGGITRLCLVTAGCALIAAAIVAALLTTMAPTIIVQVRGSALTVVEPTVWSMALALAAISVVVVTIIPLGRAVLVTAPAAGAVAEDAPAPVASEQAAAPLPERLTARITVTLGLGATALSAALLVESVLARPIADDYRYFAVIRRLDALAFLHHLDTGRYSEGLLVWFAYRLGGAATVQWMPVVLLGFLVATTAATSRAFLPGFQALPRSAALAAGSAASALAVTAAPSVVDSYLWLTSSTVYVPAIGMLLSVCLALRAALRHRGGRRAVFAAITVVLLVIAQGFYEASSLLAVVAAVIFVVVLAVRRDWESLPIGVLAASGAAAGFAVMYFAPAERIRANATGGGDLLVASLGAVYGQLQLWQSTRLAAWLFAGALGLALAVLCARRSSPGALLKLFVAGGLLFIVIPALCAFVSFYSLNWAPWRTYTVASASFCWGLVLLLGAAGALLMRRCIPRAEQRLISSGVSVVAIGTVMGVVTALPGQAAIISAESARASMMQYRDALVSKQLAAGDREITVYPAPLLVYPTDARDFEFTPVQSKAWFEPGYRSYFAVPAGDTLRFVTHAPPGYCTDDPWVAAGADALCRRGS